mmetsp:Transcript_48712/g.59921  ORF Transcript_48712/g.59921 Transcript_48712/m.59921 type:complete len:290 (+) Transcript_48712:122-991(+)
MAEEYTSEQKGKIARHFIYVAPHGEIKPLAKDLKSIVPNIVNDNFLRTTMTDYCKRRFEIIEGDTTKVICCPQAEVEPNKYLNPDSKKICTIDPVAQKVTDSQDASNKVGTGDNEKFRLAFTKELKEYLSAYYEDGSTPNSVAKGTGTVFVSPNGQIAIVISYKNLNTGNYWTGGWQSEWSLNVSKKGKTQIDGRIRLNVHYFEDGNVQLNSVFKESSNINISDIDATAKTVFKEIAKLESGFQQRLEKFYIDMKDKSFKKMRRPLPKIGTKMDWRKSVHSLAAEASSK